MINILIYKKIIKKEGVLNIKKNLIVINFNVNFYQNKSLTYYNNIDNIIIINARKMIR